MDRFTKIIPPKSLLFAPMEGITDAAYRETLGTLYPEWSYFFTDFLRIPTVGKYNKKKIIEHFGESIYRNQELKDKTGYQILTTLRAETEYHLNLLTELGFNHIDLNLGCPSKTVNKHGGGAYLLSDFNQLEPILKLIRKTYQGIFTVKIRVGYRDDSLFTDIIKLINDCGAEAITIHGRTRDLMYKGIANWDYIKKAVEISQVPIIGNGDVWTNKDIHKIFEYTNCHAVMLARGAMKTPWMAHNRERSPSVRKNQLITYFENLNRTYQNHDYQQEHILKRFKALSRYLFEDFPEGDLMKRDFMRTQDLNLFIQKLYQI